MSVRGIEHALIDRVPLRRNLDCHAAASIITRMAGHPFNVCRATIVRKHDIFRLKGMIDLIRAETISTCTLGNCSQLNRQICCKLSKAFYDTSALV